MKPIKQNQTILNPDDTYWSSKEHLEWLERARNRVNNQKDIGYWTWDNVTKNWKWIRDN